MERKRSEDEAKAREAIETLGKLGVSGTVTLASGEAVDIVTVEPDLQKYIDGMRQYLNIGPAYPHPRNRDRLGGLALGLGWGKEGGYKLKEAEHRLNKARSWHDLLPDASKFTTDSEGRLVTHYRRTFYTPPHGCHGGGYSETVTRTIIVSGTEITIGTGESARTWDVLDPATWEGSSDKTIGSYSPEHCRPEPYPEE